MILSKEDYQDLLIIINNQIEIQKYYQKHVKKQKNIVIDYEKETRRMKELIFKINKILEGS